jgi:uncharacterized metal-binding protein
MKSVTCATCTKIVCLSSHAAQADPSCPIKTQADVIERALEKYQTTEIREFARQASIQEFECYLNLPEGRTPRNPRVEETVQFAKKMGYQNLGVAFCAGLRNEAQILNSILEKRGFKVTSVCCKVGGIAKETIGITEEQKIAGPGQWESMCNPIAQAEILNQAGTDFNIAVGLCVGHDSLFIKYARALTTVLIAKDRVFGHNPAAALYQANAYYRKLMREDK